MAEREIVRPRLLRSWGLWAPVALAAVSVWRLLVGSPFVVIDVLLLTGAAVVLGMTILGGVEVGPDGVRSRRLTRQRRAARWDEILGFNGDTKEPVSARLVDGSELRLFDYAGDNARVTAELERARRHYVGD